ncbi:MAG: hypothetical protein GKR89_06535 [Candidatus Latescibacteria bacterium]|nr:hypothetical protein [Candidatus Latescibacterota bacterium]
MKCVGDVAKAGPWGGLPLAVYDARLRPASLHPAAPPAPAFSFPALRPHIPPPAACSLEQQMFKDEI